MAKTPAAASRRRAAAKISKRRLKRSKKKAPKRTNLQKQGVLGKVNGFTVTRLEPDKLKLNRIFPEYSQSPATEVKRVTFAWTDAADQSNDSRTHRAQTRRTHSARDSSEDSLSNFDASREPKRRRTVESDMVEDAEMRKATSSMRHCKASLQHSTPADMLDISCSTSKRVFPRTPKPTDKKSASPNDTFEESTHDEERGEGYSEAKVSLASLFDEETHVEERGGQEGLFDGARALSTAGPLLEGRAERTSLNSDDTTVELEAVALVPVRTSMLSESRSLNDSSDVTPVRVHSAKLKDVSKEVAPQEASAEKATGLSGTGSQEDELRLSLVEVTGASDELEVDSSVKDPPRKTKSVSPRKDDSFSSLDEISISRLSRRNSDGNCEPQKGGDVFKQRRSQLTLDEEEPMEISGIQIASRRSNAATPKPVGKDDTVTESHEVPSSSAVGGVGSEAAPVLEGASTTSGAVDANPEQEVINDLVVATEAVMELATQEGSPVLVPVPDQADSDQQETIPAFSKRSLGSTFSEDDDVELKRLSFRIKKLSERDETMESPKPKSIPEHSMLPENVVLGPDEMTLPTESKEESSSNVESVPQVESSSVVETNATAGIPPVSTAVAPADIPTAPAPVQDEEKPPKADAVACVETPPVLEAMPSGDTPSISNAAPPESNPTISEVIAPEVTPAASNAAPLDDASSISNAGSPVEATPAPETTESDLAAPLTDSFPSEQTRIAIEDADDSNRVEEGAEDAVDVSSVPPTEEDEQGSGELVEVPHDSKETESGAGFEQKDDSTTSPDTLVPPASEEVETLKPTEEAPEDPLAGDELSEAENEVREEDTETETASTASEQVVDPVQNLQGRQKRVRRNTKIFSPPPISAKTAPAPSSTRKSSGRPKASSTAETPVIVAGTPRTSRRVAAKTPSKATAEPDAEDETTSPVKKGKTPSAKTGRTPAPKTEKTPAKARAARTPSARSRAAKADIDSPEASSVSCEETSVPKTPGRATSTKKAAPKEPRTPAKTSKASAATPSTKTAKSKVESSAATEATSPPKGSKSALKPSKASTAASSRRKTAK